MWTRLVSASAAAVVSLFALTAQAAAAPEVDGEFPLPAGQTVGSNNEIVEGPDGNMWVTTEQNSVVRMEPDGSAEKFEPAGMTQPALGITVGPDGNLWAAQATSVIKIPPDNPLAASQTSITGLTGGHGITAGGDGNVWLSGTDKLVKIPPGDPTTYVTTTITGLSPRGMATGSDGLLWMTDTSTGRLLSTTTDNPAATNPYLVGGGPQDIAAGLDGQVAYANPTSSPQSVGRITPGGLPQVTNLENTDPFGVVLGQDGAYWIARAQGNDLLRLAPGGATTTLTGFAPSGGVGPRKIATGPDNTLWITLDTPEKVGRVTGVEPPPPGGALETKIDKSPKRKVKTSKRRAKVKFKFSAEDPGAEFECRLARRAKQGAKRAAKFRPCQSPKRYKLRPGRYVFEVRALSDGVSDPTPAKAKFKVVRK